MALPLIRKAYEDKPNMTEAEARTLMETCLKVLYYRDCRASKRVVIATVSAAGTNVGKPVVLETEWQVALAGSHISSSDW
jgi:20S proteasome subunit beta 7